MYTDPVASTRTDESRRYRILDVVGEGGFGKVYRARMEGAEGFAKDVAIKLLTDTEAPEEVLQRFRDESRILGLIRDRAIVTVDPPTRLDGRWAVVMEFVDGTNCQRILKTTPVPPRPAIEIVQEVARALDNVYHQVGPDGEPLHLIHRDIKPGNILLEDRSTGFSLAKLSDFGVAKIDGNDLTQTGNLVGTPHYMAPELFKGTAAGPASDLYGLGVLMYRALCGSLPFHAEDRFAVAAMHVNQPVPAFADMWPKHDIPRRLEDVVRRCLAKTPADRYASAEDLLQDLAGVRMELYPHLPVVVTDYTSMSMSRSQTMSAGQKAMGAGLVTLLIGAAALGVVVVVGLALWWTMSSPELAEAEPVDAAPATARPPPAPPLPVAPPTPPAAAPAPEADDVDAMAAATPAPAPATPTPPPAPTAPAAEAAPAPSAPEPSPSEVADDAGEEPVEDEAEPAESPAAEPEELPDEDEPAVAEALPPPAPEAPAAPAPSMTGRWSGSLAGRPLTLVLTDSGGQVSGQLETSVGPSKVSESVSGSSWAQGDGLGLKLTTRSGLYELSGSASDGAANGRVHVRGKDRGSWTIERSE